MRLTFRKLGILILIIYLLFTCYTSYALLSRKWRGFFQSANLYLRNSSKTHFEEKLRDFQFGPKPLAFPHPNRGAKSPESLIRQKLGAGESNLYAPISPSSKETVVEIWGKAAIGHYLWEHVLKGTLEERLGGIWSYGSKKIGRLKFRFRTGAGVVPEKVPRDIVNLVLVLNGREAAKQQFARMWLDFVADLVVNKNNKDAAKEGEEESSPRSSLKNVGVVLLGREDCDNDWMLPYMAKNGGVVKFAFIVYDSDLIDDVDFFQWPLGVATYRSFPRQCLATLDEDDDHNHPNPRVNRLPISNRATRLYTCNFLGTVYPNSTREELLRVLKSAPLRVQRACMIKVRAEWSPGETDATLAQYVHALTQSDLTLNPAGKNVECYRHFEAMSCGSVPVVLNETTLDGFDEKMKLTVIVNDKTKPTSVVSDRCDRKSFLRLFRRYGAPFFWVDKWSDVPNLIAEEMALSQEVKMMRRQEVMKWYRDFLKAMRMRFVEVLEKKFHL